MTASELAGRQKAFATAGIMLALMLVSLDQTVVGTAMPRIVAELQGLHYYAWVTTAYLVCSTVMVPVAGKLGDMFGRKPFVVAGMLGFMASSWLCGLSQDMLMLVLFRGMQGLFGGFLFANVFTVLADIFSIEQRAKMQGIFGGVFGLTSVIGPTIGGYITDHWGWRWVFYVNVPVGILALIVVLSTLPYVRSKASWRDIDFLGVVTLAAGVVPLLIGLSITIDHAWSSPEVIGLLAAAGVMLALFFYIERRVAANPIVPFGLFRTNQFAVSVTVAFFSSFGMFGAIIFVPLLYQGVLGISATNSGNLLIPMMVSLFAFSALSGQVMVRIRRYRYMGTIGLLTMIGGMLLLSTVQVGTSQWEVTRDIIILGAGLGVTFPLTLTVIQAALPQQVVGVATSQVQFWRNLGGTVGTAVLGSIMARQLSSSIQGRIAALDLPPQLQQLGVGSGGSPQSILDPGNLARVKASLPAPALPFFDQVITAMRMGLADALHDLFLIGAAICVVAVVASLFLREVPLRRPAAATVPEGPLAAGPEAVPATRE